MGSVMYCTNCTSPIPAERQARKSLTTAVTCSDDCRKAFNQAIVSSQIDLLAARNAEVQTGRIREMVEKG